MKGSPIIATAITVIVLLGLYLGMRTLILPENSPPPPADPHAGHDHAAHSENDHATKSHDDSALETDFELYFSSVPTSVTISNPLTGEKILNIENLSEPEWSGSAKIALTDHNVELQIDVQWSADAPTDNHFIQIILSPERHPSRQATIRSQTNTSEIAEFSW